MALLFLLLIGLFVFAIAQVFTRDKEPPDIHVPRYTLWALGLALLGYNIFAYKMGFGIGWGLFGISIIAAIFLTFEPEKRTWFAWYIAAVGVVAGLLSGFRNNEFVQEVNVVVILASIVSLFIMRSIDAVQWHGLWKVKTGFQFIGKSLMQIPLLFRSASAVRSDKHPGMATVIKTVIFTVVLLLFFAVLLSQADPVFELMIRQVREQALGRTVISIILALALLVNLTVRFHADTTKNIPTLRFFGYLELFIPTLALSLLFGLFLFVQARYLFASDAAFKVLDITYADYVRNGFLELLISTFFGCLVTYVVILKQREVKALKERVSLQIVGTVLTVELFALLGSALRRNWMYMDMYGFTRVRIIGLVFLA
ncbi:MAG: conserved rane protein of unknown function [Candidatus Peribacteria bacterium]|nr:conserved rane protein of unknown function [Candidatus Peribacteria bacterium]